MKRLILVFFMFLSFTNTKNYALVIGINNNGLKGAVNDAVAIAAKLLEKQEMEEIIYLYNKNATKSNILKHLGTIVNKLKKDDRFYLFFSGHGTSIYDPEFSVAISENKNLEDLLENSGALIPWDFNRHKIVESMISAKRDLAPIFKKIEKNESFAIVMIDACFSGMGYRETSSSNSQTIAIIEPYFMEDIYPYKNIIYLAATTVSDVAVEDTSDDRGYFSKALEQCLNKHRKLLALQKCLESSIVPQSIVVYPRNADIDLFIHIN